MALRPHAARSPTHACVCFSVLLVDGHNPLAENHDVADSLSWVTGESWPSAPSSRPLERAFSAELALSTVNIDATARSSKSGMTRAKFPEEEPVTERFHVDDEDPVVPEKRPDGAFLAEEPHITKERLRLPAVDVGP